MVLDWGLPKVIRSDGGPQFRSKFSKLCQDHGITHELSSPYNPQSNGLAESAVKQVKYLLIKSEGDMDKCLVTLSEWRNIPRANGSSPAQLFLGRRQRGLLPTLPDALHPIKSNARPAHEKAKKYYNQHTKGLSLLKPGQKVVLQNPFSKRWDTSGTILSARKNGHSYVVSLENGKETIRNRRFLKPASPPSDNSPDTEDRTKSTSCISLPRRSPRILEKKKSVRFNI